MSLSDFVKKSQNWYTRAGVRALPQIGLDLAHNVISRATSPFSYGESVYNREWDVLVVLDACRVDMYEDVVGECDSIWSVGGASPEWLANTFGSRNNSDTAYITGNPFSREYHASEFGLLDEVWQYGWDDELGTVPAEPITDRGISVAREQTHDRIILHYMQPHYPFIAEEDTIGYIDRSAFGGVNQDRNMDIWTSIKLGEITDIEKIRSAYWNNLRYVFDYVELLLENIDGTVAITADHGNALGEYGIWGHPVGTPIPEVRRVPWDIYHCEDSGEYSPKEWDTRQSTDDVEQRLANLGYVSEK